MEIKLEIKLLQHINRLWIPEKDTQSKGWKKREWRRRKQSKKEEEKEKEK